MERIKGKVALITGVARPRGVRSSVAQRFALEGAKINWVDISEVCLERLSELTADGYETTGFLVDLTNPDLLSNMVHQILEKYGRIDILVNNTGKSVPPPASFVDMTLEYWDMVMDSNLRTTVNCRKYVVGNVLSSANYILFRKGN